MSHDDPTAEWDVTVFSDTYEDRQITIVYGDDNASDNDDSCFVPQNSGPLTCHFTHTYVEPIQLEYLVTVMYYDEDGLPVRQSSNATVVCT